MLLIHCALPGCLQLVILYAYAFVPSSFQIGPLHGSNGSKARVKVRVQLNLHGIFSIESASVSKKSHFCLSILCYDDS